MALMSLMKPICTRATERDLVPDINPVAFKYSYLQTPNPTINYPLPWYCGISTKDSTGPFTYETNQVSLILARMQNALWCIGTAALKSQVALYPHPKYPRSCDRPQVRVLQKKKDIHPDRDVFHGGAFYRSSLTCDHNRDQNSCC